MLKALRQHFLLGVITNGNADVQRVGLADYFHFALRAEDIGIANRTRDCFKKRCNVAGWRPARRCMLATIRAMTSPGAQQAGLRAVWFNPTGKVWEGV